MPVTVDVRTAWAEARADIQEVSNNVIKIVLFIGLHMPLFALSTHPSLAKPFVFGEVSFSFY